MTIELGTNHPVYEVWQLRELFHQAIVKGNRFLLTGCNRPRHTFLSIHLFSACPAAKPLSWSQRQIPSWIWCYTPRGFSWGGIYISITLPSGSLSWLILNKTPQSPWLTWLYIPPPSSLLFLIGCVLLRPGKESLIIIGSTTEREANPNQSFVQPGLVTTAKLCLHLKYKIKYSKLYDNDYYMKIML